MKLNLARLNHVLVPSTKTDRDKFRRGRWGAAIRPLAAAYRAFTMEGRVLWGFWLLCGAFGLEVQASRVYLVWCAISGVLLASLVGRKFFGVDAVRVQTSHPPRVQLGHPLNVEFELKNEGASDLHTLRLEGPFLPWDGTYLAPMPGLAELKREQKAQLRTQLQFVERGEHHLDEFTLCRVGLLGLTTGPCVTIPGARFIVLPKVARLAGLKLPLNRRHQPGGVALASQTGESRELLGIRPYRPGDPIRDLHARSYARLGVPVVREYRQEYFTRIGVVLDTDVKAADEATFEAAISVTAGVLSHLSQSEALIDLLVAGSRLHRLTLGRSLGFLEQGLDLLACVQSGERLEAARLSAVLAPHLSRLSAVVFVALTWNEDRRQVLHQIRTQGIGCRAIVMEPGLQAEDVSPVDPSAVVADEVLVL